MKQKTIKSQTTPQCDHQPKASDYQISTFEYIKINLIEAFKLALFLGFGVTAFIILSFLLTEWFGG